MEKALFTGMFAAMSVAKKLDVVSNNLANVSTTAFKRSNVTFEDTMQHMAYDVVRPPVASLQDAELFPAAQTVARVRISQEYIDTAEGTLQVTNNPFDIAIEGRGYFQVQGPSGILYTRAGAFTKNNAGEIVTREGYHLLGKLGKITLPDTVKTIAIDADGNITADDRIIDTIALVDIPARDLIPRGKNLYRSTSVPVPIQSATLQQGVLEGSNVNAIEEMVNMIALHRTFEAYTKIMQTSESIERVCINQVASAV